LINGETSKEDFLNALGLNESFFDDWGLKWDTFIEEAKTELDGWKEHEYRKTQNEAYEKVAESKDIDVDEFKAYREILSKTNPEL
jgi:hypothetical protein